MERIGRIRATALVLGAFLVGSLIGLGGFLAMTVNDRKPIGSTTTSSSTSSSSTTSSTWLVSTTTPEPTTTSVTSSTLTNARRATTVPQRTATTKAPVRSTVPTTAKPAEPSFDNPYVWNQATR